MKKDSGIRNYLSKVGKTLLVAFVFLAALQVMPIVNVKAYSDTNKSLIFYDGKNTDIEPTPGTDENNKVKDWEGHYIYWGSDTSKKWQILDTNSTDYTQSPGLLIFSGTLGETIYAPKDTGNSYFDESVLRKYVETTIDGLLSDKEENVVLLSTNWHDGWLSESTRVPWIDRFLKLYESQFQKIKYFAPFAKTLINKSYGFSGHYFDIARLTNVDLIEGTTLNNMYWVATHFPNGSSPNMDTALNIYYTSEFGANQVGKTGINSRALLNIDVNSVLFMSDALASKPDSLSLISDTASNEWQLTLKDDTQIVAVSNVLRRSDTRIQFDYTTEGEGNTISAFIKDSSGKVIYYGKAADVDTSKAGTGTLDLPANFTTDNYTLHVFSEQRNGIKMTDFAGGLTEITNIPTNVTLGGVFNYKTENGSDTSEDIDYSSNDTYVEPSNVFQTYTNNGQSYRFDKWSFDVEDAVVNGKVEKSFIATAQYIKTFEVTQTDENGINGVSHTVDINADLTASKDNGGIGLVEPTKEGYSFAEWVYTVEGADVTNVTKNFSFKPKFMEHYQIDENKNWVSGSNEDLSIKSDGPFNNFIQVSVDDEIVDRKNYTVKSGSTIIEFKASYLNSLSVGIHNLAVEFTNGISIGNFEIKRVVSPDVPSTPSSSTGVRSEKYELIQAVKAISKVTDDSEFTKSEVNKIIAAKEAFNKLIVEGNPYKLTKKELETVEGYKPTINKLYNKLVLAGTVAGFGWIDAGNGDWYYFNEDGTKSTKWVAAGTYWYYVKEGLMLRNSWIAQDATGYIWYYVNDLGEMVTNTTFDGYSINIHGEWYNN